MAEPVVINVTRDIYEAFWRLGKLPLTRTIRIASILDGGKAEVRAMSCEIPAELLVEHTVEALQKWLDTLPQTPCIRIPVN